MPATQAQALLQQLPPYLLRVEQVGGGGAHRGAELLPHRRRLLPQLLLRHQAEGCGESGWVGGGCFGAGGRSPGAGQTAGDDAEAPQARANTSLQGTGTQDPPVHHGGGPRRRQLLQDAHADARAAACTGSSRRRRAGSARAVPAAAAAVAGTALATPIGACRALDGNAGRCRHRDQQGGEPRAALRRDRKPAGVPTRPGAVLTRDQGHAALQQRIEARHAAPAVSVGEGCVSWGAALGR